MIYTYVAQPGLDERVPKGRIILELEAAQCMVTIGLILFERGGILPRLIRN